MILAEDVSDAEQVDKLWKHMFQSNVAPCELMDQIGLGTAALIDDDYTEERDLNGGLTVECLRENHIAERGLGKKSALGGYTVAASCYV